jgi:hypothetical protein
VVSEEFEYAFEISRVPQGDPPVGEGPSRVLIHGGIMPRGDAGGMMRSSSSRSGCWNLHANLHHGRRR